MRDAEPNPRADELVIRPSGSGSLGVVDPLTIPGGDPVRRAWQALPLAGRLFAAVAAVDVLARTLGIAGLPPPIDLAAPLSLLGFLPHLAFVLLPVVVLWRRPQAAAETPLVFWGAVALALVELLSTPAFSLFPAIGGSVTTWTLLQVFAVAGRTAGYVALTLGLAALTRSAPSQTVLGLSNLVLWLIGAAAVTSMLLTLLLPMPDLGDPAWSGQVQLVNAIGPLPLLAFAFLARVVVRGTSDVRRPGVATATATGAVGLAAVLHALTLTVNLLALAQLALALSGGPLVGALALPLPNLGFAVDVLLVIAFALGLADTSVRIPGPGASRPFRAAEEPATVSWPAPGGEVPTYRPVERPDSAVESTPRRRRTRKSKESQA